MKLSEFTNQKHVTSVLRAMVMKDEIAPQIVIVSGDPEERFDLYFAFKQSVECDNTVKGDACGECQWCSNCANAYSSKTRIYLGEGLYEIEPDVVTRATVFELNSPPTTLEQAESLVDTIVVGNLSEVINASDKYDYDELVGNVTEVFAELLALKHGAALVEPTETARALAARLDQQTIFACLRLLWGSQKAALGTDNTRSQVLCCLLFDTIRHV